MRGRIILTLARSAIAVKERMEGLKRKVERSYLVQLDHYAPVVLTGPQLQVSEGRFVSKNVR